MAIGHQHRHHHHHVFDGVLDSKHPNRDTEAIQIKLDELIRATQGAHNASLDLDELEQENIDSFKTKYQALAASARQNLGQGVKDTDTPEP